MEQAAVEHKMIPIDEALLRIKKVVKPLPTETIDLADAIGRVLAEDVVSDVNVPPFNKAAMDGFACKKADFHNWMTVVEEIPAGHFPKEKIEEAQCARIMTGAAVPEGADTVIMIEHVEFDEQVRVRFVKEKSNTNICLLGEDIQTGDVVLAKGTWIEPAHIAVLAGAGKATLEVYKKPKVVVMPTGSELVEPSETPHLGAIRNSNGHQMVAQLKQMGFDVFYSGIIKDDKNELEKEISHWSSLVDLMIFSGGVSVGDYDYVPVVLQEAGFDIHISKMATKPGKHTLFASKEEVYALGVPGNPVSSYVQLELVGLYLLAHLMGTSFEPLRIKTTLSNNYKRKRSDRFEFLPVKIGANGEAQLMEYHGSAHIHALSSAHALLEIPIGINEIEKGEEVYVRPL
ncbi:molybdopterin molybdenumtransferase MoeA [Prolixibacteraceae bacterium JC049]|nr:molybdopterin molybdenumtransferase MoeA [Prolixibacteraceae bacterium JC049]